jgi:hypothetical protein
MPLPSQSPTPLTSPQLTSLHQHYQSQLSQIVSGMNLRKWLVEKTIGQPITIEQLEDLHAFIIKPATDGLKPPEESQ